MRRQRGKRIGMAQGAHVRERSEQTPFQQAKTALGAQSTAGKLCTERVGHEPQPLPRRVQLGQPPVQPDDAEHGHDDIGNEQRGKRDEQHGAQSMRHPCHEADASGCTTFSISTQAAPQSSENGRHT